MRIFNPGEPTRPRQTVRARDGQHWKPSQPAGGWGLGQPPGAGSARPL